MYIYKKGKKATCDASQLDDMKKAGWAIKPVSVKEPVKTPAKSTTKK